LNQRGDPTCADKTGIDHVVDPRRRFPFSQVDIATAEPESSFFGQGLDAGVETARRFTPGEIRGIDFGIALDHARIFFDQRKKSGQP
jgi:hypothetical protein